MMQTKLTITRPDDWHLHLRDGELMRSVVGATARAFGRAIIMPNLDPPVTTVAAAAAYRERIAAAVPATSRFAPLLTLYLTDTTPVAEIAQARRSGFVIGLDDEAVRRASASLGAGRDKVEDAIDPAVGIMVRAAVGDEVRAGDPVLELHFRDRTKLQQALGRATAAIAIGDTRPAVRPLVVGEVR